MRYFSKFCTCLKIQLQFLPTYTCTNGTEAVNRIDHEAIQITSDQDILSEARVDYDADDLVLMQSGFSVDQNADFMAFIDGCNGGAGGLNIQEDSESETRNYKRVNVKN